jgi:type IV pilus assembly protein PilY1
MNTSFFAPLLRRLALAAAALGALAPALAFDLSSTLSQTPLIVTTSNTVAPNVMFVLDNSGSMAWDFMPDHINSYNSTPKLCRSGTGATGSSASNFSAGSFGNYCCINAGANTCWSGNAPFASQRGQAPFMTGNFNVLAYNPTISYLPPVDSTGASLPTQNSANTGGWASVRNDYYQVQNSGTINLVTGFPDTEWCTSATVFTNCVRNGNYVLPGNVTVNGTTSAYTNFHATTGSGTGWRADGPPEAAVGTSVTFGPHYYTIVTNEYCDSASLKNCQAGSSGAFTIPAPVRWCTDSTNAQKVTPSANTCQAQRDDSHTVPRYPTKYYVATTGGSPYVPAQNFVAGNSASATYTVALSGCNGKTAKVNQLTINGINVLVAAASVTNNTASSLAAAIKTNLTQGNYSATNTSGSASFTVTAPHSAGSMSGATTTPSYTGTSSGCTITLTGGTYSGYTDDTPAADAIPAVAGQPAARFVRTDIVPGNTYPKAAGRTDCVTTSGVCTYDEEMTNFANWWAYYHTRMQAMKTATALSFNTVSSKYRVGYYGLNNNGSGGNFINPTAFSGTARATWFSKLTASIPNSGTPLRLALSNVGRYYGGKLTGQTISGGTAQDPLQYYCQKNFTILSTDGFWNNDTNYPQDLAGNALGDRDSNLAAPMKDGLSISNTLADAAAYYNLTDLRTGTTGSAACLSQNPDVTNSDVCGNGQGPLVNNAPTDAMQTMTTYTIGLGASGSMQFIDGYAKGGVAPDYDAIVNGSTPTTTVCNWQSSGTCTWPKPVGDTLTAIDDLWHAAVNGGGTYFSATDPRSIISGLTNALSAIDKQTAASAAVATSNPNVTAGDANAYVSTFTSGVWAGELQSVGIDLTTGDLVSTPTWSAAALLDAQAWANRKIYMFDSSGSSTNKRKDFTYANMTTTEQGYFSATSITSGGGMMQFCTLGSFCLSTEAQAAAVGQNLVNFIRGDRSNEGALLSADKYFRQRQNVLGDIVDSEAAYVKLPLLHFSDTGYAAYKTSSVVAGRQGMVYVGANDGMLHAFVASTGQEAWAYVPSAVLPNLFHLADKGYGSQHQFYVNSSPIVRDVYDGSQWHTVLISGLGAGGRSYFALDVTDPTNPLPLWEFTDTNLGYTLGKPEVGKLANGTWVAIFPSGYNNVSPGDGEGRLYVLNAVTGAQISGFPLRTYTGSTSAPSNLAQVRAWVDNADADNTIKRLYGGDNLGNLWRFDVNDSVGAAGNEATLLATLRNSSAQAQPLTARPALGMVDNFVMVYVGTGRYLGVNDIPDTTVQSIYAIKDQLTGTGYGNPRADSTFVQQVLTTSSCPSGSTLCTAGTPIRQIAQPAKTVDLHVNNGWYVDLPANLERANTDPDLVLGTLVVNTNVTDSTAVCKPGGSSWQNYFDYRTGAAVKSSNNIASVQLVGGIASRPNIYAIGSTVHAGTTTANGRETTEPPPNIDAGKARRVSWRELTTD